MRLDTLMREHGVRDAAAVRTAALDEKKDWARSLGRVLWNLVGDDEIVAEMDAEEREDDIETSWGVAMEETYGRAVKQDLKVAASSGEERVDYPERDDADDLAVDEHEYETLLEAVEDGFRAAYNDAAE